MGVIDYEKIRQIEYDNLIELLINDYETKIEMLEKQQRDIVECFVKNKSYNISKESLEKSINLNKDIKEYKSIILDSIKQNRMSESQKIEEQIEYLKLKQILEEANTNDIQRHAP